MKWIWFLVLVGLGCPSGANLPVQERVDPVTTNEERKIEAGVSTAADVEEILGKPNRDVAGVKVGSTTGLQMMSYDEPARSVFLKDNKVVLVVDVAKVGGAHPTTMADWNAKHGKPQRVLPSAQGKNFWTHVYMKQGLAVTFDPQEKALTIESFAPMSADDYERTFYRVPTKFVK